MRALHKDTRRSITHTLNRFLAIFLIVALGVGFLAGLQSASPDMKDTADLYYKEYNLMDVRVQSVLGMTDDDIAAIEATAGVEDAVGTWAADLLVDATEGTNVVHFMTLPDEGGVNGAKLVEGRWPESPDECVADIGKLETLPPEIGDTVKLSSANDEDSLKNIRGTEFTVVGRAETPEYVSFSRGTSAIGDGKVRYYVYITKEAFDMDVYTAINITLSGVSGYSTYDADYENAVEEAKDALSDIAPAREQARYDEVMETANAELDDARAELSSEEADADAKLAEASQKIEDAGKELADAEAELADGKAEIADGWDEYAKAERDFDRQISDAQDELDAAEAEISANEASVEDAAQELAKGEAQLGESKSTLDETAAQLDALHAQIEQLTAAGMAENAAALLAQYEHGKAEYDVGLAQYEAAAAELAASRAQLEAGKAQIQDAKAQLDAGRAELQTQRRRGRRELDEAKQELEDAEAELADGEQKITDAKAELADGRAEYDEKKAEADEKIADAWAKIDDAQKEIDDIELPEWYITDRVALPGYTSFESDANRIHAIASVFPIFFFLVAALVCLTTMTRMIEEERTQIGMMKALGYSKAAIASKYLLYAAIATVAGSVLGCIVGPIVLPKVIWGAYNIMYNMPELVSKFRWGICMAASAAALAVTLGATFSTCRMELSEFPAQLMRPRAPKPGKRILLERITPLWRHMSFSNKVTARNIFRYKKRFLMTVVGIAGCTALLLTGFGLKNSIAGMVPKQFGELFKYQAMIVIPDDLSEEKQSDVHAVLNDDVTQHMAAMQKSVELIGDGGTEEDVYLVVPQKDAAIDDFVSFRHRGDGSPLALGGEGVLISEKTAEDLGANVGSSITIKDGDRRVTATVTGVFENYVYHYVYMTEGLYETLYEEAPEFTMIYAKLDNEDKAYEDDLATKLLDAGALAATFTTGLEDSINDTLKSLDAIVYVLILCASMLCFVVLYNLTNINITERKREIATIKVLGFYDGEVSGYVFRENVALTVMGTAVGLVLGIALHAFVIKTAEVDAVMFCREINAMSYVISAALTFIFAGLVNFVMHFRLKYVSMVESMKAVE